MKLRWPLAAIILALLGLVLLGGPESTVFTWIGLTVLTVGITVTIWGLIRRWPM